MCGIETKEERAAREKLEHAQRMKAIAAAKRLTREYGPERKR